MKMSQMAIGPIKLPPGEATTINHRLLVQGGFVRQLMAGVYTYLPLGLRVLEKIRKVVREEMDAVGGQEIAMPALHPAAIWKTTGNWNKVDVLFKLKSRTGKDYALGQSHEEVVTPLAKEFIRSYKDLPLKLYQIQEKFRDELRAKSGILRGREFEMKDMYSFHEDKADFERFYNQVKQAYIKIFDRMGLVIKVTEASGGAFTEKISYEFMVLTGAGEDDILYCDNCEYCVNKEIAQQKAGDDCPKCHQGKLHEAVAAEVGNVFDLGQKFAKDFEVTFIDREGKKAIPVMGCYGIGITRTMGVAVEQFSDEKGIIWPKAIAPYQVSLLDLGETKARAQEVYNRLVENGVEVLWDDRAESAGIKFADADMIGNPYRIVISEKTGDQVELKKRDEKEAGLMGIEEAMALIRA